MHCGGHFFDDAPISIIVDRWLDELSAHVGYACRMGALPAELFRARRGRFARTESQLVDANLALGTSRCACALRSSAASS